MTFLLSQRLFVLEVLLIAAPWSIAFVYLGLGLLVPPLLLTPLSPAGAVGLLALIGFAALLGAWVLTLSYLRGGNQALAQRSSRWWLLCATGALILATAVGSHLLPSSPDYSNMWRFRQDLALFLLGLPLILPLGHLAAERWLRTGNR